MDSADVQFVGAPCGHHGPYTFYKAFKYMDGDKMKILSLGDFFFLKILEDIPVCIGEIQLLWEEKGTNQLLASVRMYFQPQDTPDKDEDCYGEDELLAVSEKLIITAHDLRQLVVTSVDVNWCYGRYLHSYNDLEDNNELTKGKGDVSTDLCQAFAANNRGLLFHDVDKEKMDLGVDKTEPHAPVVIMSYPQYCRYRAVLKRLETVTDVWLKNALVMAIGGFASMHRGMRVMFCREVCDYPELDDLEFRMDHLAPNLKGRPRKKRVLSKKDSNQESDSNGYGSDQSSTTTTSSISGTPKVKSQRIVNKNGLSSNKRETSEEEKEFLVNLYKFMDKRNSPIDRLPSLGFKQIDLYLFYKAAQQLGGYDEITDKRMWKVLYDNLGGNPGNTSAATNTRRHYERLILPYEKHLKRLRIKQKGQLVSGKDLPPPSAASDVQNGQVKSKANRKLSVTNEDGELSDEKKTRDVLFNTSTNKVLSNPVKKEENEGSEGRNAAGMGTEAVKMQSSTDRGQEGEGRKVMKVEDLYDVQAIEIKSFTRQRPGVVPLEVPVVRQRMTTSIMSPIMQRKLTGHHHHHHHGHANSQLSHAHGHHHGAPQLQAADGHSVLRAPSYSLHLGQISGSTPPSRNHHHHRNNHHSDGHHHQQHPYNSQPAHQRLDHSSHMSQHQQSHLLSSSSSHQQQHLTPAHSGATHSSIPQHLKAAPRDLHSPSALAFQSPDLRPLPSEPPPAHSKPAKCPNAYSHPPAQPEAFPHPDQVLSRIQNLHQSIYPSDPKRPKLSSPATSISSMPSSSGSGHDEPLDLSFRPACSIKPSSSSLHIRKEGGLSRAQERKQKSGTYTGSSSSSSSTSSSSSVPTVVSQGSDLAMVQGLSQDQQDMPQQPEVLLQSALFGAQFTALPRPVKTAEMSPSMVPLVHPAFMQAAFSPLGMYSAAQLSPTALQLAAYEELVRQKALSTMAPVSSSPSFMMSPLPSAYSQPTKETQK